MGKKIRWLALFAAAGVLFLSLVSCTSLLGPSNSFSTADLEAKIFKLVNDYRLSVGKAALVWNDLMAGEARTHSQEMADGKVPFGHDGFNDRAARINESIPWSAVAENVASSGSAEDAVNAWLQSADHKVNIEGNFDLSGVGVAKSASTSVYYFTQMFLKPR